MDFLLWMYSQLQTLQGQISTELCDQQQLTKDSEDADSKKFVFQSPNCASSL